MKKIFLLPLVVLSMLFPVLAGAHSIGGGMMGWGDGYNMMNFGYGGMGFWGWLIALLVVVLLVLAIIALIKYIKK